jgi:hypothetical protein
MKIMKFGFLQRIISYTSRYCQQMQATRFKRFQAFILARLSGRGHDGDGGVFLATVVPTIGAKCMQQL